MIFIQKNHRGDPMICIISMYFFEKKSYGPPYDFFSFLSTFLTKNHMVPPMIFLIFKYFFDKKSYGPPYDFFEF